MPPKRASKRAPPSSAKSTSTSSATTPIRKSTRRQTRPQPRSTAPSDREILASFRAYAVSRDAISNPSDLSDDEDEDDDDGSGLLLRVADVRRCLRALELPAPPADFFDEEQRVVRSGEFVALARTLAETAGVDSDEDEDGAYEDDEDGDEEMMVADSEDETQTREIDEAFALFLGGRPGGAGAGARITVADLRRVARSLKEDVDDKTLALMIEEANGEEGKQSVGRGVGRQEFEEVMRRARVFV